MIIAFFQSASFYIKMVIEYYSIEINKMPENKKSGLAVALLTDKKYLFACGTFIINILDKIPQVSKIIIFYCDISQDQIDTISKIDDRIQFREYSKQNFIDEYFSGEDVTAELVFFKLFTHLAAVKFKVFKLLDEYEKVVFFDVDMLIADNIDFLFDKDDYNIIWKSDNNSIYSKIYLGGYKGESNNLLIDYNAYKNIDTPNGGFIVVNSNFDYNHAYNLSKKFLVQACKYHPTFIDEITFGYIAYKLNLKIFNVDGQIINVSPPWFNTKSKLLHFMRQFKPWNYALVQILFPTWLYNYTIFSQKTGIKSDEVKYFDNIGSILLDDMRYDYWQKVINKFSFPELLKISHDLKRNRLRLYFDDDIFFDITKTSMQDAGLIFLNIKKQCVKDLSSFDNIYREFIDNKNIIDCSDESFYKCRTSGYKFGELQYKFNDFYNNSFILLKSTNIDFNVGKFIKTRFLTHFNKYICVNGHKICQTIDKNLALEVYVTENKIIFKINNSNMFINKIYNDCSISVSDNLFFYEYISVGDKLAIKVDNNYYLSARNDEDGSMSVMPHYKAWELFKCE